ncbi:helix-turn-helix domain-containing protein [Planococcus salinus]|uniref:Helix-turn-helix domain-containing protein n=1 Tax=Planococcus salinus TaxID=1848460 RepID=A0A3M8P4B8_9BACL|nr:helix-turn-helix transcriptional regulator [Planococcus salinus]RNF38210.1 helix-turn-helix domain-containing protein [Planococcus salinus]
MDIGLRLKYHRVKRRKSLEETARNILTPRELKKIEAGEKEPSLQVLEALCKKLEIPLAPKDNPVGKVLVKNFKSALLHPQNKGKIMEQYADIHNHPLLHIDENIELEYSIQQIRYFIITGDLESAEEKIKEMERFKEFMDQEQFYLFHKYLGNYHYILNDYETALNTYLLAEKIAPSHLASTEMGDLYYSIGISSSQCWETDRAYKYTKMALKIYQQEFIPKRIVECHSNIALSEFQFGNFKSAIEHYRNAYTIGSKLENDILKFTTEYNYAYTYFLLQEYDIALIHLESSLQHIPPEYIADILLSYTALIKCNLEMERINEAKEWIEKGIELKESNNLNMDSLNSDEFKELYCEFICLVHLVNEEYDEYEKVVTGQLLPSLEANNHFHELAYHYGHVGNVYSQQKKFEKAANCWNKSRQAYRNLINYKMRSGVR